MTNPEFTIMIDQVQRQDKEDVTIFYLRGWLDAQSEPGFVTAAQDAKARGVNQLVVHMEDLTMLTSAGIRALHKTYKIFSAAGAETHKLRLCCAQPQVQHALTVTGLLRNVPVHESLQSALKSLDT